MNVTVLFHSYFRELTGSSDVHLEIPDGTTLSSLVARLQNQFPRLNSMEKSMLMAVGVEYQPGSYILRDGDEVSLFPPVQGG